MVTSQTNKSRNNVFISTDPGASVLQYNTVVSFYTKTITINITLQTESGFIFQCPSSSSDTPDIQYVQPVQVSIMNDNGLIFWLRQELRVSQCLSVCPLSVKSSPEQSIFIFLGQRALTLSNNAAILSTKSTREHPESNQRVIREALNTASCLLKVELFFMFNISGYSHWRAHPRYLR